MKRFMFVSLIAVGLLPFVGCSNSAKDVSKLKQELKQEILAELRRENEILAQASSQQAPGQISEQTREQMKAEIEREILAKIQSEMQSQVEAQVETQVQAVANRSPDGENQFVQIQVVPAGKAEGYILYRGTGLEGCDVKLVRIFQGGSILDILKASKDGAEFTAVTDDKGKYVFEKIPIGAYKLKWQLPDDTGWIRRLRDKPDAVVAKGQTALIKSVEASRRLIGR